MFPPPGGDVGAFRSVKLRRSVVVLEVGRGLQTTFKRSWSHPFLSGIFPGSHLDYTKKKKRYKNKLYGS